jgi:hypothetical protein
MRCPGIFRASRIAALLAAAALLFAVDGAGAREHSRTGSVRTASGSSVIVKSGDRHHRRHGHRFVFIDRPNDEWLIANHCVVRRIGPDGYPVQVIVRRVTGCRVVVPTVLIGY